MEIYSNICSFMTFVGIFIITSKINGKNVLNFGHGENTSYQEFLIYETLGWGLECMYTRKMHLDTLNSSFVLQRPGLIKM